MTYKWFPFKMDWLLLNEQAVQPVYATCCVQRQIPQEFSILHLRRKACAQQL